MIRNFLILLFLSAAVLFSNLQPAIAANATTVDLTGYTPDTIKCYAKPGEYTKAIVDCIQIPTRAAVLKKDSGLLALVSKNMLGLVPAFIVLAVIWLGVRATTGDKSFAPRAFSLAIRIGIAITFTSMLFGYAPKLYEIFDQMAALGIPAGLNPWVEIDKFLAKLLGFTNGPESLKDGIVGLITGSFFAKNLGIMVSIIGCFTVISLLLMVCQAVYIYLASIITLGFLIVISPIVIPFFLFTYTESYLNKWFDILLACFITPMLMFAYMSIFITSTPATSTQAAKPAIFQSLVDDVMKILGPDYLKSCLRRGQPLGNTWLMPVDITKTMNLACIANALACNPINPPSWQINMNPTLSNSFTYNYVKVDQIDCGPQDAKMKKDVFEKLLELFLLTFIMGAGLKLIPSVSSDICRGASSGIANFASPLTRAIRGMK